MRGISSITDFFVICSASSDPQIKAISGSVTETLREKHGIRPIATNGIPSSQWVIVDFVDVLVHVLHQDKREYYALDELWGDARKVAWELPPKKKTSKGRGTTPKPSAADKSISGNVEHNEE